MKCRAVDMGLILCFPAKKMSTVLVAWWVFWCLCVVCSDFCFLASQVQSLMLSVFDHLSLVIFHFLPHWFYMFFHDLQDLS